MSEWPVEQASRQITRVQGKRGERGSGNNLFEEIKP